MGVFEMPAFAAGTLAIAKRWLLPRAKARPPSSAAAIRSRQCNNPALPDKISHISTGGGASLEFLGGAKLPGVEALTEKS